MFIDKNPKALISDLGNDNAGQWVVNLDMTAEGRKKWSRFTAKNINRKVAIVLDDEVFMAPTIRDKITAGSTQISGFNDMEEAKNIASILWNIRLIKCNSHYYQNVIVF